ncbi:hypothetical protein ACYOEI_23200 [Singulisphaera rosea]
MQHPHDIRAAGYDLIQRYDGLSAGCDPDFDADLEELEREFAELRLHFDNHQ